MIIPKDGTMWGKGAQTYIKKKALELATGSVPPSIKNDAMEWGNTYESVAREKYESISGDSVSLVGFVEMEDGIGCSPDGFIGAEKLIEIKCPYNQDIFKGYIEKDEAPKQYLVQMLHQMITTGRFTCEFFAFDPRTDSYYHKQYYKREIVELLSLYEAAYIPRIRAARDAIKLCAEAIELYKSGESAHVCACKSQELTFSDIGDIEEKMPWE